MRKFLSHPVFEVIHSIAKEQNLKAFVIGGFVRDILLNRTSKDIDIVVEGSGIELAKEVAARIGIKKEVTVFKNFGTAMLLHKGWEIEFVGARRESYNRNSRKPIVENGTLEDDQKRRDFTINALAISLSDENYGELIDPFDGVSDLKNRIIRTPLDPDITFSDDPLRMMRAIRFAAQLDFSVSKESLDSITRMNDRIKIVSKERINDELNKIVLSRKPSIGFYLLDNTGILPIIFPELIDLKGVEEKDGIGHKDNFIHSLKVLDNISKNTDDLWLRWSALLHDIGKPKTKRFEKGIGWTFHGHEFIGSKMIPDIFRKLKFPLNEKMKYVAKLVGLHLRPISLVEDIVTDSAVRRLIFDAGNDIEDIMLLAEADITSKNERKIKTFLQNFKIVRQKIKDVEERDAIRNFEPPVKGEEIIELFGIEPGREVGIIKNALKDAILDGIIPNNYEAALSYVIGKGKELGLSPVSH